MNYDANPKKHQPDSVPIVDIYHIMHEPRDNASYLGAVSAISKALEDYGVFIAVNHGISLSDINTSQHIATSKLFSLTLDQKMNVSMRSLNSTARGYIGFGQESGLKSNFEPKEGYSYGYDWNVSIHGPPTNPMQQSNIWPKDFPLEASAMLHQLYLDKISVGRRLEEALSYIDRKENGIGSTSENGGEDEVTGGDTISLMRIFHYFPPSTPDSKEDVMECIGSSPHTDWGYLTLISQDSVGGLQFYFKESWVSVPVVDGGLVINGGDYLHLKSKGKYRNPIHRVLCPKSEDRISFVLFYYPSYDTPLLIGSDRDKTKESAKSNNFVTDKFEYNTLTSLSGDPLPPDSSQHGYQKFGDYIVKKWKDVFRAGD